MTDAEIYKLVDYLMTSGDKPSQKAARLALMTSDGKDLGGWGRSALIATIRQFDKPERPKKARAAK